MEQACNDKKTNDPDWNLGVLKAELKFIKTDIQNKLKKGMTATSIYEEVAKDIYDNYGEDDNMDVEVDNASEGGSSSANEATARANAVESLAASLRATEI